MDLENIPPARARLVVEAVLSEKKSDKDAPEDENGNNLYIALDNWGWGWVCVCVGGVGGEGLVKIFFLIHL